MRNVSFVCTPVDRQEICGTTPNFNTTWQIKPSYQDGWVYPFPPGSEDPERLTPPAVPEGFRELPLFPGDRNVKRTAEPQEYNVFTLTHLYQCSGTLHKHSQTETLPSSATRFLRFGLGLCPQDLAVFPLLVWPSSLDIHYTLKHFSWVPSHLRPSPFPLLLCCSVLPSSLPSSPVYHLAADWLTSVFSLYLRSFISCGAYSTCGTSEMEVLCSLSVKQTHTNSQTYLFLRYTHIIGCAVEYGKSIWARWWVAAFTVSPSLHLFWCGGGEGGFAVLGFWLIT